MAVFESGRRVICHPSGQSADGLVSLTQIESRLWRRSAGFVDLGEFPFPPRRSFR